MNSQSTKTSSNRISQIRWIISNVINSDIKIITSEINELLLQLNNSEINNNEIEELMVNIQIVIHSNIVDINIDYYNSLITQIREIIIKINTSNIDNILIDIANILKYTGKKDLEQITSQIDNTKKSIILAVQEQSFTINKVHKWKVIKFINTYILSLNSEEIKELEDTVEYYEDKFEKLSWDLEEDYQSKYDIIYQPLNIRIQRLLFKGTLIPEYNNIDESKFIYEMNSLLIRLKNNIENQAKKIWFNIIDINYRDLLDLIKETEGATCYMDYSENIDSYLRSINYYISIPEKNIPDDWFDMIKEIENELGYSLKYFLEWDEWITREELITFLTEKGYNINDNSFSIYWNDHIEIKVYINNKKVPYNSWDKTTHIESVKLDIYIKQLKVNIDTEDFLDMSVNKLNLYTQSLINDIYWEFWHPSKPFTLDLNNISEWSSDDYEEENKKVSTKVWQILWSSNKKSTEYKNSKKNKNSKSSIILEDSEMKELHMLEEQFKNEEHFENMWVTVPKWIILHWPAWTGKTLFAKHISEKIDAEFIIINQTEILNMYVWESEKKMQSKFNQAKNIAVQWKKVIMFFDEADSLFEKRWNETNHKEWIISIILQEMDWIHEDSLKNIFIFFTTNRLNSIDPAVLSRFDKKLKIWLPNLEKRIEHFKLNIDLKNEKSNSNLFKNIDYKLLAEKTKWKSWRFIKQLINNAVLDFAHNRLLNSRCKLITTEKIIEWILLIEN